MDRKRTGLSPLLEALTELDREASRTLEETFRQIMFKEKEKEKMCKECDEAFDEHLEESARGKTVVDERDFQAGDIVAVRSDGPDMVIDRINSNGEYADCTWFPVDHHGNYLSPESRTFHTAGLFLVEAVEDQEEE